jgi:hypothetical protein
MRLRRLIRDEGGAAVVEFALVMPILALIVFGIIDFGRAFYVESALPLPLPRSSPSSRCPRFARARSKWCRQQRAARRLTRRA